MQRPGRQARVRRDFCDRRQSGLSVGARAFAGDEIDGLPGQEDGRGTSQAGRHLDLGPVCKLVLGLACGA